MQPAQVRAARALIGMTQGALASLAGVSLSTVVDFERERRQVAEPSLASIRVALESAGVIFLDPNGEGAGVRLRKEKSRTA